MKIMNLVEIICDELEWDDEIINHCNPQEDLVYYADNALYIRGDLSISSFTLLDNYNANDIRRTYNTSNSSLDIELFSAIDTIIRNVYDCEEDKLINMVRTCFKKTKLEIDSKLYFDEISSMKNLIDIVGKNDFYSTLLFNVKRYSCIKDNKYRGFDHKPTKYTFGNKDYHRDLDVVNIEIYDDVTSLHYIGKGAKTYEGNTTQINRTDENDIIYALNLWKNYFDL